MAARAFVCGTSGESMSLTLDERKAALEAWVKNKGSLNVIAQVGTTSLEQTRDLAAHAESVGAAGIATMAPFFFKPPDVSTLVDFCASVTSAAPKTPFLYYHYPGITGVNLPVFDFFEKAHGVIPTLRGAKFTGTELGDYYRTLCFQGGRYDILMGFEYMHLPCLPLGSKGGISLSFSFCAPVYAKLFKAYHQNDLETARKLQLVIAEFMAALAQYGFVPASKLLMREWHGLDMGPCRLPLRALSPDEEKRFMALKVVQELHSLL